MASDNIYDNVPHAVAAIIGPNMGFLVGTGIDHPTRRKELLALADQLTRTMVAAMAERDRPKFNDAGDAV